jgi:hypothetical protein
MRLPPVGSILRRATIRTLLAPALVACATARVRPAVNDAAAVPATSSRAAPALVCTPPAAPVIRSALYFGLRRASGGGEVTAEEWATFLAREITPRFGGLTVFAAEGQWLGSDGPLVRERSRVVVILHPDTDGPRAAIADVIRRYRARFDQQSVLWETTSACAAF